MTNEITDDQAKAIANDASKQGTFNFLDRLAGRAYAKEDLVVYLDEAAGYELEKLKTELSNAKEGEAANEIQAKIDEVKERAAHSRFVIHLEGISTEEYDSVVDAAQEEFPYEYIENRHPLTMALERTVKESEGRDRYFRTHLWAKYIRSVEAPDGSLDTNITPEFVAVVMNRLPLMALGKLGVAIDNLRMITDWMDRIQNDDFFPKP